MLVQDVIAAITIAIAALGISVSNNLTPKIIRERWIKRSRPIIRTIRQAPIRRSRVPINIKTRGVDSWRQVGVIHNEKGNILPLFGRRTYNGSDKWNYYTASKGAHSYKVPINIEGKQCDGEYGCKEIYDGDSISLDTHKGQKFKTEIYNTVPKYIPIV